MNRKLIFLLNILLRIFSIGAIFIVGPIWGIIIDIFYDSLDGQIFRYLLKIETTSLKYQIYDKFFDLLFYCTLIYILWQIQPPLFEILVLLFVFRLAGQLIFLIGGISKTLLYFPNIFEETTLFILIAYQIVPQILAYSNPFFWLGLVCILIFKIYIEYALHIKNVSFMKLIIPKVDSFLRREL